VRSRQPRVARFMNKEPRQMRFNAATGDFRFRGRLTGFRSARRIVRIRTNDLAAKNAV
jgi:methyl coenzyme M reductase gamma subunit